MTDSVRYELDGPVAAITIDDGKVNALGTPVLEAVLAGLDQAERDGAAVVLSGRAGTFSAGFDLKTFAVGGAALVRMLELGATLSERILAFPRPVVVGATGHALAAGAFLLLAADVRLGAAGDFRIGLNETRIGLTLPWFVVELARHRLAPGHLDAAIVHATIYSPADAVAPGYLDRVVASDSLAAEARATATALTELDPRAFADNKARLREPAVAAVAAGRERMMGELRALAA
jgi:enoyl-CoA hydratase